MCNFSIRHHVTSARLMPLNISIRQLWLVQDSTLIIWGIGELRWTICENLSWYYSCIDSIDHLIKNFHMKYRCVNYWHSPILQVMPLEVLFTYEMYLEVAEESSTRYVRTMTFLTSGNFVLYFPIRWSNTNQTITHMQVTPIWDLLQSRTKRQEIISRMLQGGTYGVR